MFRGCVCDATEVIPSPWKLFCQEQENGTQSRKNFISANQNDEVQNEARKESRNHGVQQAPPRREVLLKE